jgi:hypothetical protein
MVTMKLNLGILIAIFFGVAVIAVCATLTPQPTRMIVATQVPNIPSTPEDIIDARLLPARELLTNSNAPEAHWLSLIILNYHIKIYIVPQLNNDEWSEFTYISNQF